MNKASIFSFARTRLLGISFIAAVGASPAFSEGSDFNAYFKIKDASRQRIEQTRPNAISEKPTAQDLSDKASMIKTLQEEMKEPLFGGPKPSSVDLNFESLAPGDQSQDCLDGLVYNFPSRKHFPGRLFVSDLALVGKTTALADQILKIQCDDTAHRPYGAVRNIPKGGFDEVEGILSLAAQDIGPLPPNELVVIAKKGSQVYVFSLPISEKKYSVDACNAKFSKKSEEKSFDELTACYRDHFEKKQASPEIQKLRTTAAAVLSDIKP